MQTTMRDVKSSEGYQGYVFNIYLFILQLYYTIQGRFFHVFIRIRCLYTTSQSHIIVRKYKKVEFCGNLECNHHAFFEIKIIMLNAVCNFLFSRIFSIIIALFVK